MSNFRQYRRTQIAETADWAPGFDMSGVSVSEADRKAGSPKAGDKIARNPANHEDRWLVAADYFAANFEPLASAPQASQPTTAHTDHPSRHWDRTCPACCEGASAKQRFDELQAGHGLSPIERLRAFCSLAMQGQDWIDVEPFFDAVLAASPLPAPQEPAVCKWTRDDFDSNDWNTDCGERYTLNEGTPGDNMMRFCCYCGKPVESCEPDDYAAPAPVDGPRERGSSDAQVSGASGSLSSSGAEAGPQVAASASGYCTEFDRCVCGGDLPSIRAGCHNWRADRPISATQPASHARELTDEEIKRVHDTKADLPDLVAMRDQWPRILLFARAVLAADRALREQGR